MTPDTIGLRSARSAPGLFRILGILARHGFIQAVRGQAHWPTPANVREALEELGLVFLKLGEVLALRTCSPTSTSRSSSACTTGSRQWMSRWFVRQSSASWAADLRAR
jgi:hypothetical protein